MEAITHLGLAFLPLVYSVHFIESFPKLRANIPYWPTFRLLNGFLPRILHSWCGNLNRLPVGWVKP